MNNKQFLFITGVLFLLILTACQEKISSSGEKTLCAPQTVEVTRIVPQVVEVIQNTQQPTFNAEPNETNVPEATSNPLSITIPAGTSSIQIDPAYFDGVILLTRYYTLLDQGRFDEVLLFYSSSLLRKSGGGNFETDLKSVELTSIRPYNYWLAQQGIPSQTIPENEIRYVVGTIVIHKAPAWNEGGTPMPDGQTRFVSLILEDGEWKLNEFNSSPWFQ